MYNIKFRAISLSDNKFCYGSLSYGNEKQTYIGFHSRNGEYCYQRVKDDTVGQFIGLKDDNGVEIFVGDIVKMDAEHYVIEWNDLTCKFQLSDGSDINDGINFQAKRYVVGNKFDNKKLYELAK